MKSELITTLTTIPLLITTVICGVTGLIKWPGLASSLGISYRQIPLGVVTDIHIWSGLCMIVLAGVHVYQFRSRMKRAVGNTISRE